jgi:hypothetical protein
VVIALFLRLWAFPHFDEIRDLDEVGYLNGSLALFEGLPPGYKAAPAGPNTWVGWLYTGGIAAAHLIHPGPEESGVPWVVRPFVAINRTLFDQYHDLRDLHMLWIVSQLILGIWAVAAGYRLGFFRAGIAGGLLVGGLLATVPMFVEFTEMSRSYSTAWSFGVLALYYAAARQGCCRRRGSGVFLGLAIASRIEMVLIAPIVLWEFWNRREPGKLRKVIGGVIASTIITTLLAAPWLMTHLLGNLRTIFSVRLGPNFSESLAPFEVLKQIAWGEGACAIFLFPLVLAGWRGREKILVATLACYVLLLILSMFTGTVFLRQQGPALVAIIVFSAMAIQPLAAGRPVAWAWVLGVLLLLPLVQSARRIVELRGQYSPDPATAWVAAHIPAGTRVYIEGHVGSLREPLPTPEAASFLWQEVTDDSAWRKKFESGLSRFHLQTADIPPALSEENLVQERGNRRGLFILGSRPGFPEARFDIRVYHGSPVFGVQDIAAAFASTGGTVIWRGLPAPASFGPPVAQWTNADGNGTFIYCSGDIAARLPRD